MSGARSGRWALVALCGALALGVGCKKNGQPDPAPPAAPATVEAPSTPAAKQAAALSRIPADAVAVAVASGPEDLATRLGRAEVVAALGTTYTKVAAVVALQMGRDLLDPATWSEIGVDASGPVGIVWLGMEAETGAVFVTVSDPGKLRAFVDGLAQKMSDEFEVVVPGDPVVLRPKKERDLLFVIAKDSAFLVFGDRGWKETEQAARRIASQAREGSLAVAPAFSSTLDELAFGRDVTLWVDVPSVVSTARGMMRPSSPVNDLTRQRDEAKKAGDVAEAERLGRELAEEAEWAERSRRRAEGEVELLEATAGALGPIAIGGQIEGAALRLRATSALKDGSMLARGLRNGTGTPELLRALAGRPLLAFAGSVDPAVALDLMRVVARADGDDLDQVLRRLKEEIGIDVVAEVLPTLTGDAGFALIGDAAAIMAAHGREMERSLGFTMTLGVKDEEALRAALVKLWASPALASIASVDKPNGSARLAIPNWRDVHVALVGKTLVVTTDLDAFGRLQKAGRGAWLEEEGDGPLGAVVGGEGPAAMMIYDSRLMGLLLLAYDFGDWGGSEPPVAPENPGAEWKKLQAAYDAARKEEADLKAKVEANEARLVDGVLGGIGFTVVAARVEGARLAFTGAQVVRGASVPAATSAVARLLAEGIPLGKELRNKRLDASARVQDLRSQLRSLETPSDDGGPQHALPPDPALLIPVP